MDKKNLKLRHKTGLYKSVPEITPEDVVYHFQVRSKTVSFSKDDIKSVMAATDQSINSVISDLRIDGKIKEEDGVYIWQ